MNKGKLIKWNNERGFGFVKPENGEHDVFIHISALKKMRRKPVVGDTIFYEIHTQNDGKIRAVNASIEGVKEYTHKIRKKPRTNLIPRIFSFLLFMMMVILVYQKITQYSDIKPFKNTPTKITPKHRQHFVFDGRQYCRQMRSREEAVFFINHCPDTKMDGDHDGIPCENDSRF